MSQENNMELMQTLDDAWNSQDWETFNKRHAHDTVVGWPGGGQATKGRHNHETEAKEFFKTYPNNRVENHPYKVFFAQGDWTCSFAKFTGTLKGPMRGPNGTLIPATNKSFEVDLCTVAHWLNGEIVEENLFFDLVGMMKQIGLA